MNPMFYVDRTTYIDTTVITPIANILFVFQLFVLDTNAYSK